MVLVDQCCTTKILECFLLSPMSWCLCVSLLVILVKNKATHAHSYVSMAACWVQCYGMIIVLLYQLTQLLNNAYHCCCLDELSFLELLTLLQQFRILIILGALEVQDDISFALSVTEGLLLFDHG